MSETIVIIRDNTTEILVRDTYDGEYMQALMKEIFKIIPIIFLILLILLFILILFSTVLWLINRLNPYRIPEEELEDIDLQPEYYESEMEEVF